LLLRLAGQNQNPGDKRSPHAKKQCSDGNCNGYVPSVTGLVWTLEIGAGTGTNALWLAERGFEVLGIDVAPHAIERATAKLNGRNLGCRFRTLDFLLASPPEAPFHFVFDRGCFHVFDEEEERARFAAQVAAILAPGGVWLSLIGSTEGPPREVGPPRRSARDVARAIEPALEIVELRGAEFRAHGAAAWFCLARRRGDEAVASGE
jgi:SAM-dependent methyltransferase